MNSMFLQTLCKVANRLDKLGYYDIANQVDAIIYKFATEEWIVKLDNKAQKLYDKLPRNIQKYVDRLRSTLSRGPMGGSRSGQRPPGLHNLGPLPELGSKHYHAHIKDGSPVYVSVWEVTDIVNKTIMIRFVGTRENAPY